MVNGGPPGLPVEGTVVSRHVVHPMVVIYNSDLVRPRRVLHRVRVRFLALWCPQRSLFGTAPDIGNLDFLRVARDQRALGLLPFLWRIGLLSHSRHQRGCSGAAMFAPSRHGHEAPVEPQYATSHLLEQRVDAG